MTYSTRKAYITTILINIFVIVLLYGCGAGASSAKNIPDNNAPQVTLFSTTSLSKSIVNCSNFNSNVAAINNNGVVAGFITSPHESNSLQCVQHDYLWDSESSNSLSIIPFPDTLPIPEEVTGASIAALSTNLISAGITFINMTVSSTYPDEFASYNQNLLPNIINGWNYIFGVSENGQFLVGTNLGGNLLLFDTTLKQPAALTLDGTPLAGAAELISVSNDGTAVGIYNDTTISPNGIAIICKNTTQNCYIIDESDAYSSSARSISSNGQIIYGVRLDNHGNNTIFQVNPETYATTTLFDNYTIYHHYNVTNNGIILVTPDSGDSYFIYVPKIGVYSVSTLINNLHLPSNIDPTTATISPNGKYIAFDVSTYTNNNIIGAKVFFPLGIESYLSKNITSIPVN